MYTQPEIMFYGDLYALEAKYVLKQNSYISIIYENITKTELYS